MRVAFGNDHGGLPIRQAVIEAIWSSGHEVLDLGTDSAASSDYPDFARVVGLAIQAGEAERGILLCGSGVGVSIAANKLAGVYAAVCHDTYSARQGVEHDNMNVLCLGGRVIGPELARELVIAFLSARFSTEERFARRAGKVSRMEQRQKD